MVDLPSGTGKSKNIAVLDEAMIEEIFKSKAANADIYLASPEIMPKVGKIARILGTQGKMPSPKSGTVTSDVEKTKEALEGGRIDLRADAGNVLHQAIGRLDWDNDKLMANYFAIIAVLPKSKIQSITFAPTMGPGVKVAFKK
jgi:large subunit ribosomal protein L1